MLLLFAFLNLHLFGTFALWAAEDLGGFDVAYAGVLCSLDNAAYTLCLVLLAWSLLTPFCEACNYLFFVDTRTRFEGLDLWNRVQDYFPLKRRSQVGVILLALGASGLVAGPALADELLPTVKAARQEVQAVREEVKAANPYPGGRRWVPRLEAVGKRLQDSSDAPESFRWFQQAVGEFAHLNQKQATNFLDELDNRLALLEDSLARPRKEANPDALSADQIKNLIPPDRRGTPKRKVEKQEDAKQKKDEPKVQQEDPLRDQRPVNAGGPISAGATPLAGAANGLLILLIGLMAAALAAGIAYIVYAFFRDRPEPMPKQAGALAAGADDSHEDPAKLDPAQLWRQADDRARAGDYLGAVRTIYLAVLAMLHQGGFIRYERTRTNGEYVDQLRPRQLLQRPFQGLTGVFEVKWYGERHCESNDYHQCRELAEEIRVNSRQAQV
jgi:hypothetical protein